MDGAQALRPAFQDKTSGVRYLVQPLDSRRKMLRLELDHARLQFVAYNWNRPKGLQRGSIACYRQRQGIETKHEISPPL